MFLRFLLGTKQPLMFDDYHLYIVDKQKTHTFTGDPFLDFRI